MKLERCIISKLEKKVGRGLDDPAACDVLSKDIFAKTGELLSVNTLKRLVGIIRYESSPRTQTLDIIARYLGASDWRQLCMDAEDEISGFGNTPGIESELLPEGTTVELRWSPGRRVLILHKSEDNFIVMESEGSKLRAGDCFRARNIIVGFPLLAGNLMRDGVVIGDYCAAREYGLESVKIVRKE